MNNDGTSFLHDKASKKCTESDQRLGLLTLLSLRLTDPSPGCTSYQIPLYPVFSVAAVKFHHPATSMLKSQERQYSNTKSRQPSAG